MSIIRKIEVSGIEGLEALIGMSIKDKILDVLGEQSGLTVGDMMRFEEDIEVALLNYASKAANDAADEVISRHGAKFTTERMLQDS